MIKPLFLWCCVGFLTCMAHVTFTNLKCINENTKVGEFDYCRIKAVNRTHKYVSILYKLYQRPLNNISIHLKVMRNNNGYKPFFYDVTIDACQFLRAPRQLIYILLYNTFKDRSNMNHTCPYDHDIILDKLYTGELESEFTRYLPIPMGDYALYTTFSVEKVHACSVNMYLKVSK